MKRSGSLGFDKKAGSDFAPTPVSTPTVTARSSGNNVRKTINLGNGGPVIVRKKFEKPVAGNDVNDVNVELFKSKDTRLKPDKVYRFHCGGMISREFNKLRKGTKAPEKEVKYRAEFSGSVEEFVYPSLRSGPESKSEITQPVNYSTEDETGGKPPNDFALHWKLDIEEKPERLLEDGSSSLGVAEKGENTLRELLRKKYRQRFTKEKASKSIHGATQMTRAIRKQNMLNSLYGEKKKEIETPDDVVSWSLCYGVAIVYCFYHCVNDSLLAYFNVTIQYFYFVSVL
jgi:hypothetical protein